MQSVALLRSGPLPTRAAIPSKYRLRREIQRHVEISSIVMVQEELREILEQTDAQLWDEETALEEELAEEEQTSAGRGKRQQRKKKKKKN